MACKKVQLRGEEHKHRNDVAEAMENVMTDALLFATMCLVGMAVDVHTQDGSMFSGTFYTASVDKDYAIVLKKAKMIKKGNRDGNVANGTLVETLIIQSEDLVQVVAKGVQLPANGISGYIGGDSAEISLYYGLKRLSAKKEESSPATTENLLDHPSEEQNGRLDAPKFVNMKNDETHNATFDGRQVQDGSQKRQRDSSQNKLEVEDKESNQEVHGSYLNNVKSESFLSPSLKSYTLAHKKGAGFKETVKESKLNPGAKIFSPAMVQKRMVTPPVVPNGTSVFYMPETYTMAPVASTHEVDASSFSRSSGPVKFVPRNNPASANVGYDAQYAQPMIAQVVNRSQPVRYIGQYHQIPAAPAYSHLNLNPQNVMVGRIDPLICVHPIAGDIVQSEAGFSTGSLRPPFTMHQLQPPKHQANASAQAMHQLCMAPPQPLLLSNSIPISLPVFPVLNHPITVPGSNHYLSTKFV